MFSAYIVFGRRRLRAGDPQAAENSENVTLLESWVPDSSPAESVDDRLKAEGLPPTPRLAEFCFGRKKMLDDTAGLVPPALQFTFTLTMASGDRIHCYCLRAHRPDIDSSHRLDVGGEWIEVSAFITKYPFHRLFPAALNICRVRRALDRPSHLNFLQQLHRGMNGAAQGKGPVIIESPCMNVACKFEFSTSRDPKLDCIFDTMTPQTLQYVLGAVLLERRICLVGRHEKRLSDVAYALTHLACGEAPLKGYCHNFVPILPGSMLEVGLSNPAPYIVGILRIHVKATDTIKGLGDIVIVDLDSKTVRISSGGGSPILPLGLDVTPEYSNGQQRKEGNDQLNPWQDVCGPFCTDLAYAFKNRDLDMLMAAVRATILIVTVGKLGTHLDDPAIRLFSSHFRKTQIASAASNANESAIAMILGNRGYISLRAQLSSQQAASQGSERASVAQASQMVTEITSAASKSRPDLVTKSTIEIAKRSYDAHAFFEGLHVAIQNRLEDCQGRNWKHAYKALGLFNLLLRMGSELVVADCWDLLGTIFELTRYSLNGAVGVPSRVAELVKKRAAELYSLVVDLHALTFARSYNGHIMIQRATRQKMQAKVSKIPLGKDLKSLLDVCAPDPIVEPDVEDATEETPAPRQISTSGVGRPPPPPPAVESNDRSSPAEGLLLDLDNFSLEKKTSGTGLEANADVFAIQSNLPRTPISVGEGAHEDPSASSSTNNGETESTPHTSTGGRPSTKLVSAFDPKPPPARPDTKLITVYDLPPDAKGDLQRPRRPRTLEGPSAVVPAPALPARPVRQAPMKPISSENVSAASMGFGSPTAAAAGGGFNKSAGGATWSKPLVSPLPQRVPPPPPPPPSSYGNASGGSPTLDITSAAATSPRSPILSPMAGTKQIAGSPSTTATTTTAVSRPPAPRVPPGITKRWPPQQQNNNNGDAKQQQEEGDDGKNSAVKEASPPKGDGNNNNNGGGDAGAGRRRGPPPPGIKG